MAKPTLKSLGLTTLAVGSLILAQWSQAHDAARDAADFNVTRRLVVISATTNRPQLEMIGNFTVKLDKDSSQLEIVAAVDKTAGVYKTHYVGIGSGVTYVIEDISSPDLPDNMPCRISYMPESMTALEPWR